jgi:hypothetical protein
VADSAVELPFGGGMCGAWRHKNRKNTLYIEHRRRIGGRLIASLREEIAL